MGTRVGGRAGVSLVMVDKSPACYRQLALEGREHFLVLEQTVPVRSGSALGCVWIPLVAGGVTLVGL